MRISDWSSDVCSSDLSCRKGGIGCKRVCFVTLRPLHIRHPELVSGSRSCPRIWRGAQGETWPWMLKQVQHDDGGEGGLIPPPGRSEEHTSELQSLMRISYAVFCLNKKQNTTRSQKWT